MGNQEPEIEERADRVAARAFGRCLKHKRKDAGLTRADLSRRAGISASYLASIERGSANPTLDTMVKLADVVGSGVAEMLSPGT
ncbi:helix-turn-helix transcriptional regulator [Sphingomonas sp.]|uniref:helix-turn-helix domain-containing protein n=1 Tax=Sphingomonas sp. TaxID=28214 RepID=UPI000DB77F54|nr:helix-turn-helix transcriptional regulator [Sphingomonas sp.]PZU06538.1 MAG: XRE family transcriptional regulator [Sphingomonas sp.]